MTEKQVDNAVALDAQRNVTERKQVRDEKKVKADYNREYYKKNQEKILQKKRDMNKTAAGKAKKADHNREYYKKNREKIRQKERDMNKTEAGKAYNRQKNQRTKRKYADGTYKKLTQEQKQANAAKRKNCPKRKECLHEYYSRQRTVLRELREGKTCAHCPHDTAHHLEFDHLDPTKKIQCVTSIRNIEKLRAEAAKCQLLCIWCHRIKSWKERRLAPVIHAKPGPDTAGRLCHGLLCQGQIRANKHYYLRKGKPYGYCKTCTAANRQQIRNERAEYVNNLKRNVFKKCQTCPRKVEAGFEMCFDFDHNDRATKKKRISAMVNTTGSQKALDAELAKCRLLCCYCHKDRTAKQLDYYYLSSSLF